MKRLICGLSMLSLLTFGTVSTNYAQTVVKEKRGWSHGAKDAVIGGAAGGVAGGLIGHGLGGAAIGAAVGAGGGYLVGHHKDRRTGYRRPVKIKERREY